MGQLSDSSSQDVIVEGLRKQFRLDASPLTVLDDISFSVSRGEIFGIVGPSGCGKTTLLRIIASLESFDSGIIQVFESEPRLALSRQLVSFVFQRPTLLPWRTVFENVRLVFDVVRSNSAFASQEICKTLDLLGLLQFKNAYPSQLSGGMQARVALARAWVAKPKLLLLDEPFSNVDALTRWRLNLELLKLITTHQITTILVTHSLDEATLLSDNLIVLNEKPSSVKSRIANPLERAERQNNPRSPMLRKYEEDILRALESEIGGAQK